MTPQEVENTRLSLLSRINTAIATRKNQDYLEQANVLKARLEASAAMPPTFKCKLCCAPVLAMELEQLEINLKLEPKPKEE